MTTVAIGDRDLRVRAATLGFVKDKLTPARKALRAASEEEMPDRLAELVLCYVERNAPPVTLEWLLDNLPADPSAIIRELIVASGQKVAEKSEGEAVRQ